MDVHVFSKSACLLQKVPLVARLLYRTEINQVCEFLYLNFIHVKRISFAERLHCLNRLKLRNLLKEIHYEVYPIIFSIFFTHIFNSIHRKRPREVYSSKTQHQSNGRSWTIFFQFSWARFSGLFKASQHKYAN